MRKWFLGIRFEPIGLSILIFIWLGIFPQYADSQMNRAVQVTPDQEKRSFIRSVDGYAFLSEDMTLAQTREAAFVNAKRQAVEMVRTYIQSKTKVEDFVLKSDKITASSEGAVTVLEQKDHGVEDNNRYHVWIKAEVEYGLTPKGEADKEHAMDPDAPLTVKVWTPEKLYKDGENITIYIQGNRNFYARIVNISSDREIIQLLPNEYRKINYFEAGKTYKIPDRGDLFSLTVRAPFGEDQIVVYASEVPLGRVDMEQVGQGLSRYSGTRSAFAAQTRGIAVMGADTSAESGAEFYEATWKFKTGH
ncbi:MAG: DUF4384 domain-containing protein [Proteobacteria bacterium]|nr:DUF4384 domain-containing protein [Pseudomonadota bacterium]